MFTAIQYNFEKVVKRVMDISKELTKLSEKHRQKIDNFILINIFKFK